MKTLHEIETAIAEVSSDELVRIRAWTDDLELMTAAAETLFIMLDEEEIPRE